MQAIRTDDAVSAELAWALADYLCVPSLSLSSSVTMSTSTLCIRVHVHVCVCDVSLAVTMSTSSLTPTSGPNTAPNTVQSSFQNEAQQAVASTRQNSSITLGAMSMEMPMRTQTTPSESSGIRILSTATQGTDKQLQVFNGLRVRMGIATGDLGKGGVKLRSTPIMERSKGRAHKHM